MTRCSPCRYGSSAIQTKFENTCYKIVSSCLDYFEAESIIRPCTKWDKRGRIQIAHSNPFRLRITDETINQMVLELPRYLQAVRERQFTPMDPGANVYTYQMEETEKFWHDCHYLFPALSLFVF